jgi:hypothetical protein
LSRRSEPVLLKRESASEWEQGAEVIVEAERLDNVLGNCARALYFHETGKKFAGPVHVITAFTMYKHAVVQEKVNLGVRAATEYFSKHPPKGANPDVFWYKFEESENTAVFLMHFYGNSEVLIRFDKRSYAAGEP